MRLDKVYHRFSLLSSIPSSPFSFHHSVSTYKKHISIPIRSLSLSLSVNHTLNHSLKPITHTHFLGKPTKKMSTHSDFNALAAENVGPIGSAASPPTQTYENDGACVCICFFFEFWLFRELIYSIPQTFERIVHLGFSNLVNLWIFYANLGYF